MGPTRIWRKKGDAGRALPSPKAMAGHAPASTWMMKDKFGWDTGWEIGEKILGPAWMMMSGEKRR
jgi:hypothetical protein